MVGALTPAERREARGSSLIAKLVGKLPKDDAARVRKALDMLISDKFEKFLDAVASGKAEDIKTAYDALETTDKGAMYMNAGFLASIDRIVADPGARAAITAMTTTGRSGQYDAMVAFIAALVRGQGHDRDRGARGHHDRDGQAARPGALDVLPQPAGDEAVRRGAPAEAREPHPRAPAGLRRTGPLRQTALADARCPGARAGVRGGTV